MVYTKATYNVNKLTELEFDAHGERVAHVKYGPH